MDTYGGLAVGHTIENESSPKGWVIGPLFQSFKSKMASFTEIVMCPVKLFRANSPSPSMHHPDKLSEFELQADGISDGVHSEPNDMFHPEAQSESENRDFRTLGEVDGAQNAKTVAVKYCKKLSFDVELPTRGSQQADECAITQKEKNLPDSVPLQHSPSPCFVSEEVSESVVRSSILLQPSVNVSASHESQLKISSAKEEQNGKLAARLRPLPRKCTGNRRKVTSKTLTAEVKKQESDPEVIDGQLSCLNSVTSNKADSSDIDKALSLSSSVYHAQPNTDCSQPDDEDDGRKTESCHLVRQSLRNNVNATGRPLKPTIGTQQLECQLNPETYSAADLGRAKRELKLDCHSQDFVKRKRLTADIRKKDTKKQELVNVASESGALRGLRPPRKEVVLTNSLAEGKEMLKPARKRQAVSTKANKKGKGGQEMLSMINETVLNTQTETSSDAMLVCSLGENSGVSEENEKGSSKVKASGSCKRPRTRTGPGKPDVDTDDCMDQETTVTVTSTKQAEQEPLSEVLVRPNIKQLQSTRRCRNINKKPLKRKLPNQVSSATDSDSTVVSTSSALPVESLEVTPTDFNTSQHAQNQESRETGLTQQSKRPRKGFQGAVKLSSSGGSQETKQCIPNLHLITKENESQEGKGKIPIDPVYFEMTPVESTDQPGPSPSQPQSDCYVQFNNDMKHFVEGKEKSTSSVRDEEDEASNHSSIDTSRRSSRARWVNNKPRRKGRVLNSRTRKHEETNSITMDDADLVTADRSSSENGLSRCLLRSYSCPEIPSLRPLDMPWTSSLHSLHQSRIHTPHQHQSSHTSFVHHAHKSLRRARRHTVCSVEVEREIAPLCLRKEVYPSRRSLPYDSVTQNLSPSVALSPSTSLSALASGFLSSPLAFLSKKVDSRGAAASPSTSSHVSSPTSSSSIYMSSPSTWRLSGFLQRTDSSSAILDCSSR